MKHQNKGHNRPILVTGAGRGIGYACAIGLHNRGYRVFATSRDLGSLAPLAELGIETLALDITDDNAIHQCIQTVLEKTDGQLYAVLNNAGYGQLGAVEDLKRHHLHTQFETNVYGTQMVTNAVLPLFRTQGFGRIIYLSSILGIVTRTYCGAYNASKFAVEALADTLRLELRGTDIFVSLIEPGPIESNFRRKAIHTAKEMADYVHSIHHPTYQKLLSPDLESDLAKVPFTLGPEAVLKVAIHALESKRPKARYPVTVYAHLFSTLKRVLPTKWLDRILALA